MQYESFLNSIIAQIEKVRDEEETDLVLLKNHLNMLVGDIERSQGFKEQLQKCKN